MYRRDYHSFQQRFTLPSNVDADKIEAHCENGVLEVLIPKNAKAQPRKIDVQSGKGGLSNKLNEKPTESGKH
jgi:HSP20 family protein